ncbi:MAG TPA: hypothetical protein VMT76_13460 [Puia sp.]|nr:hypothetical protein [Puia sp.]
MVSSFVYLLFALLAGIIFIIFLTARFRIHAFFTLLMACFLVGLLVKMPVTDILNNIREGFGNIMKSLGFIIVLGTTLGIILEHNGSISVLSDFIISKMGKKYIVLSMNIIGFLVGMPVFCDSGFIILSSLNKSISRHSGITPLITSVSLASGLLSVHCLIPPHPGASAAAALLEVDFGKLMITGIVVALPASLIGYLWSVYRGKNVKPGPSSENEEKKFSSALPTIFQSFYQ